MFTLTGTLEDHAGKPVADSAVVIIPSPSMTKDASGNTVYLGGTTVYTDANGDFTASLVANEDNIVYTVRSAYGGPLDQPIHFNSPADGATIDLADVVPVQAPDKYASYVTGASAYEVAVKNGFVGTELQWLNSLEGEPGHSFYPEPTATSMVLSGATTLPIDKTLITVEVDAPSTLTVPLAPPGTIITMHVVHGWENITWGSGVTVTGAASSTETWVVLVSDGTTWTALVSGNAAQVEDSGLRNLNGLMNTADWDVTDPTVKFVVQRVGNIVQVAAVLNRTTTVSTLNDTVLTLPLGFRPRVPEYGTWDVNIQYPNTGDYLGFRPDGEVVYKSSATGLSWTFTSFITADPWPSPMPGTPDVPAS